MGEFSFTTTTAAITAVYLAFFLVKVRYVARGVTVFFYRLKKYKNEDALAAMGEPISRVHLGIFILFSALLSFILLIPMVLFEGTNYFRPYDEDVLDHIARTAPKR